MCYVDAQFGQNVYLARTPMPHKFEQQLKNRNTLCEVRQAIKDTPGLSDALRDSMSVPIKTIGERFQRMEIKGKPIKLGVPASDSLSISSMPIHHSLKNTLPRKTWTELLLSKTS